jgi:molecular chaperone GrpE (heat shock protein)
MVIKNDMWKLRNALSRAVTHAKRVHFNNIANDLLKLRDKIEKLIEHE